jgi:hypothetical protein
MENNMRHVLASHLRGSLLAFGISVGGGWFAHAFGQSPYPKQAKLPAKHTSSFSRSKTAKQAPKQMAKPPVHVLPPAVPRPVLAKDFEQKTSDGLTTFTTKEGAVMDGYYTLFFAGMGPPSDLVGEHYIFSSTGHLRKGVKQGEWITHFFVDDRDMDYTETYQDGLLNGPFTVYNADKTVHYYSPMAQGNGVWKAFYARSKRVRMEGTHKNGKEDGIWRSYGADGQLREQLLYANGNLLRSTPASGK